MARSRPHRVLVVDDQVAVAEVVRDALEEAGYAVTLTSTGVSALNLIAYDPPDVVLLDLGLRDMLGLEVLDRLRARWPEIPVIILSGTQDPDLAKSARARGAADYVTKPFELQRLLQVVRVILATRIRGPQA